jgi:hypothetical protein
MVDSMGTSRDRRAQVIPVVASAVATMSSAVVATLAILAFTGCLSPAPSGAFGVRWGHSVARHFRCTPDATTTGFATCNAGPVAFLGRHPRATVITGGAASGLAGIELRFSPDECRAPSLPSEISRAFHTSEAPDLQYEHDEIVRFDASTCELVIAGPTYGKVLRARRAEELGRALASVFAWHGC